MDENKSETLFDELMTILLKLDDFREYNLELFSKIELHNYDQFVDDLLPKSLQKYVDKYEIQ